MIIAESERLLIRHFHPFDADALDRVFGDAEVMRYGFGAQTPDWVRAWLRDCLQNYQQIGFGVWAVVEKQQREVIGYCGLTALAEVDGQPEIEIGYRFARAHWERGFATEAARAVRDYAFDVLCLPRLVALIDPQNAASIRVAEKLGMQHEKEVLLEGYSYPDRLYALDRRHADNPVKR
jgi:hypothetical protein